MMLCLIHFSNLFYPSYLLFLIYFSSVLIPQNVDALECISYHDFKESGKPRRINLGFCGASTGYCVRAVYADPNYSHKNGYSLGCDKTDCQNVGNPLFGWDENGCKANTDFGADGHICCCNDKDHCNEANSKLLCFRMLIIFTFLFQFIYQFL